MWDTTQPTSVSPLTGLEVTRGMLRKFTAAIRTAPEEPATAQNNHTVIIQGTPFTIPTKYTPIKGIGHGAYGVVISASNSETNKSVAIKKVNQAFEDEIDAKRVLRKIKLLRHFQVRVALAGRATRPSLQLRRSIDPPHTPHTRPPAPTSTPHAAVPAREHHRHGGHPQAAAGHHRPGSQLCVEAVPG